ncbi:hypothetical protein L7F22_067418 [Adiantum nelumboides]|nr:hypothetical protein [Adiantum nelumboides]
MAASAPILGTTQDAPRPITWTYELTPEDKTEMQTAIEHFSGRTLVGRLVGTTQSRPTVREWIESALGGSPARILELSMMTVGLFLLQLSDSVSTDALLARSSISSGSELLVFQLWTPQFDQDEFDRQQQIPRFPMTLSFSSLPIFMRRCIPRMAARWCIVIPGSFVSEIGTPRIQVYAPGDTQFPDLAHMRDRAGQIRAQRMVVTGVLPRYFSSEWSFAQFRLPEDVRTLVAFGPDKTTILIIGSDGSFYRCSFDPAHGGEMQQKHCARFLGTDKEVIQ